MLPLRYPLRSLWVRRSRAALTVGVIALVVLALALMSGLVSSMRASLESAGSPRNLIVLRKGATSDGASTLPLEVYQALRFFDGVARGADGEPLVSPELVVQPFAATRRGGRESAPVRGVEAAAFALRDEVKIRDGRRLQPSSGEAIVGRAAAARYAGADLGGELALLAGVGAAFGATNTLYATVQARTREIGTLRALGFTRLAIAVSFLFEAALIAVAGFAIRGALAGLGAAAISAWVGDVSIFATDGTALVALRVGARDLAAAFALALTIGLGGATAPALRAARLRPIDALRKG